MKAPKSANTSSGLCDCPSSQSGSRLPAGKDCSRRSCSRTRARTSAFGSLGATTWSSGASERALPPRAIVTGHALEVVDARDGRVGLQFSGIASDVVADRVVFALPFTVLRELDLSGLVLSPRKRRAIAEFAMGTNPKLNLQLDRSFAALDWTGSFPSDELHYVTWDSTYGQTNPVPRTPVLTIYNGGNEGASYPTVVAHAPASAGRPRGRAGQPGTRRAGRC